MGVILRACFTRKNKQSVAISPPGRVIAMRKPEDASSNNQQKQKGARGGQTKRAQTYVGAITDSAERIGADNAIFIGIVVLSFGALALRVDALQILLVAAGLIACRLGIRLFNMRTEERRLKRELEQIRVRRGLPLAEIEEAEPRKITSRTGND